MSERVTFEAWAVKMSDGTLMWDGGTNRPAIMGRHDAFQQMHGQIASGWPCELACVRVTVEIIEPGGESGHD